MLSDKNKISFQKLLIINTVMSAFIGGLIVFFLGGYATSAGLIFSNNVAYAALTSQEQAVISAIKKIKPSVVNIDTYVAAKSYLSQGGEGIGSGIIVRENGYILTNRHVIRDATNITVTLDNGKQYSGKLVNAHSEYDLALIKINASSLKVAKFGDSTKVKLGQTAIAIGNPLHFSWTVTLGVVSALERDIDAGGNLPIYRGLIQTDAAINPGNSGGPLINSDGEVIGINTLIFSGTDTTVAQGLGFAIPGNTAKKVANELIQNKGTTSSGSKPWIGIKLQNVTRQLAQQWGFPTSTGVLVVNVIANSPAQRGGLCPGDIIVDVRGKPVKTYEELIGILSPLKAGTAVELGVWHEGRKVKREIILETLSQ
ncbi:MAG TPA: trypsin-like peptidase domain-containing protein [Candidatus Eremiobacteraeota bacterium]|nr:MAG: putative serine protease HtrA [bacterium ADurb.Bin363]HPZ08707.1 trypsin-like peptidase domain-containing protein [Candidatus Eremiobacteraeota bacterium]